MPPARGHQRQGELPLPHTSMLPSFHSSARWDTRRSTIEIDDQGVGVRNGGRIREGVHLRLRMGRAKPKSLPALPKEMSVSPALQRSLRPAAPGLDVWPSRPRARPGLCAGTARRPGLCVPLPFSPSFLSTTGPAAPTTSSRTPENLRMCEKEEQAPAWPRREEAG